MKTNILNFFLPIFFLVFLNPLFAQSDREIVDNFKKEYSKIESEIKSATTLDELNTVIAQINSFKENYAQHKDLLDKSLYPDNYNESIDKLNKAYLLRQGDFTTIDVLQTQVGELKQQVEFLNTRNNELLLQIKNLEARSQKDAKSIKRLENLVAELRSSIRERDELVMSMVDSLMPPIMEEKEILSAEDKSMLAREEQKENVLDNVKTTIKDNIRFMQVTSLKPDDLTKIREQQKDFAAKWQKVGVKLVEVYAEDKNKTEELKQIDNLFQEWYEATTEEAWTSIDEEFSMNGIVLRSFNNGEEFTNSVILFINDELKNIGVKSDEESKRIYTEFADSVWFKTIQPIWLNYLIENKQLTEKNKNTIEAKIAEWKNALYPPNWWIYLVAGLVIIAIVAFFIIRGRKSKASTNEQIQE
ncbi:MAG: hypothetical protein P8X47_13490 [Ignavibacteriaceae bacterium]